MPSSCFHYNENALKRRVQSQFALAIIAAKEMFKKFDKKGTGKISTNDIIPAFKSLNMHMNADKIKEWADMLDENGALVSFICSLVFGTGVTNTRRGPREKVFGPKDFKIKAARTKIWQFSIHS